MHTPLAIANYFIVKSKEDGIQLSPMKLQKLVYYAHGWHLALTNGRPLINEGVYAWPYGPVIKTLYHKFKKFGRSSVTIPAIDFFTNEPFKLDKDQELYALLDRIWDVYSPLTAIQLSNATHKNGSPWAQQYVAGHEKVICDKVIMKYFQSLMGQRNGN